MIDKSLAPSNENWSVLGIGVAVRVRVSTSSLSCLSLSLGATPNFCSSSIISNPRSLNFISLFKSRCVPIIISVLPLSSEAVISFISFEFFNLLR